MLFNQQYMHTRKKTLFTTHQKVIFVLPCPLDQGYINS